MKAPFTNVIARIFPPALTALLVSGAVAHAAFVYPTEHEIISSGDFDGDGRMDAVVLDRATGNARVGYQNASGALVWAAPVATGVANADALSVGRFYESNRAALAVTSVEFNRVRLLDVFNASNAPAMFTPSAIGPRMLVSLDAPAGVIGTWDALVVAGQEPSSPVRTLLELFEAQAAALYAAMQQIAEEAYLSTGNSLQLGDASSARLAAMMQRGSNDTFVAYSFSNAVSLVLARSNLPPGTEYVFGRFNDETYPRFLFYVPGQSNIIVQHLEEVGGQFVFSAETVTTFTAAVQRVYFVEEGTDGLGIVQFGNGAVGVRPAGGSDGLVVTPGLGLGAAGNVITGVVPLGSGQFALLSGASNSFSSVQAQVFTKSGSNYVQTSTSAMSATSTAGTRANVWLFASEPFVNTQPGFVASLSGGDWIRSVSGLPGTVSVVAETDRGVTNGLGNPTTQNLGAAPNSAPYGIANQFHPAIALFSYASPRAAQLIQVTISPPPGTYSDPIDVSFSASDPGDRVYFRVGTAGAFQQFGAPFNVRSNAQVQYYAERFGTPERSPLETASYTITGGVIPPLNTNTNGGSNVPPVINPSNGIPSYAYGTVFYSRRTGTNGAIWSIALDGHNDRFLTEGTRPRLSPEGRYLAFLRGGRPFDTIPQNNGDIWIRDLLTGDEWRLVTHTNLIVGFDWEYGNTNLVFDQGCGLFRVGFDGNITPLPFSTLCTYDAPAVNPIDGSLAFHSLAPLTTNHGIYVTDPAVTMSQYLNVPLTKPRRPAWSPDGTLLAVADYSFTYLPESGENLYVVNRDGSAAYQITGFTQVEGFREGALWTPYGDALIGAANISGVNGIWIVPLTPDRHGCGSPPIRLPTLSGDDIDFVGTVFVPPPPPRLTIYRQDDEVIVRWRRTAWPYVLQTAGEPIPGTWVDLVPPYSFTNLMFEFRVPNASAQPTAFFRLRLP